MLKYFSEPYPHNALSTRHWLLISAGAGAFVGLFLVFFQPFGSDNWEHPRKPFILGGYGAVTFFCMALFSYVLPRLFKTWYSETHWTVGREIIWTLSVIVLITVGNLVYSQWLFGNTFSIKSFTLWLGITASVGIIPTTIITLLNYNRLLRKYTTSSLLVKEEKNIPKASESFPEIRLTAENEKETLVLSAEELLFIESADNYSEVVFWKENKVQKVLLRSSLSRLDEQIKHPSIARCHRSYIINLQQVKTISGNAQGYKLQLQNWETALPVARRYTEFVKGYFKN